MTHLRNALTEQWGLARPKLPLVSTALKDMLALVGLGLALMVSFAITATSGALDFLLLRQVDLTLHMFARVLLTTAGSRTRRLAPCSVRSSGCWCRQPGGPLPAVCHRVDRDSSTATTRAAGQ